MVLRKEQFHVRQAAASESLLEPCSLSAKFPRIVEFLAQTTWEDGSLRQTGTITLMTHEGVLKAALNDRESSSSAFVSGNSLLSLLKAVETGLESGSLEFRVKAPFKPGTPRRRT